MTKARIFYHSLSDDMRRKEKLDWFRENKFESIPFTRLVPDEKNNWINNADNDFDTLLPLIDKEAKAGKTERAIFKLFSRGVATQRDEWVYDFNKTNLEKKTRFMVNVYQKTLENQYYEGKMQIKWDRELDGYLKRNISKTFSESQIIRSIYRPFIKMWFYFDKHFNGMIYQLSHIFPNSSSENKLLWLKAGSDWNFFVLAIDNLPDLLPQGGSQCLPLYRYDATGVRHDNITDWGLWQFRSHYNPEAIESSSPVCYDMVNDVMADYQPQQIEKEDIFHYTYAVLHDPAYRTKYELNLKRDFPRLPFYADFWQWAAWGKQLMELHIGYESMEPYPLRRTDVPLAVGRARSESSKQAMMQLSMIADMLQGEPSKTDKLAQPKCKLKANKEAGTIEVDEETTLSGIPSEAWEYKLGNRSALEWVLDQYKEKKPSDPTIAEQFNTYRFADYKEQVIDLLGRVCAVSLRTVGVVDSMRKASS